MAIARDSGVPSPLLASATGTVQTVTANAFTPTNSGTLVVVTVACENFIPTNFVSNTVSWSGGTPTGASTWTKRIEAIAAAGNGICQVWTATGPNAGVSGTVTSSTGASSLQGSISLMVDVLTGALGAGASAQNASAASGANNIAVSGVRLNSWVYVADYSEGTTLPWYAGTTQWLETIDASTARTAVGVNTWKLPGTVTVGWVGNTAPNGEAALEIIEAYDATDLEAATASDAESAYLQGPPVTWFQGDWSQNDVFAYLGGSAGGGGLGLSADEQDSAQASDLFGLFLNPVWGIGSTEAAQASDSVAGGVARVASETDTANASDSEAFAVGIRHSQTDTALASDGLGISLVKAASQTDNAQASDQLGISLVKAASQADTALASDTLSAGWAATGIESDTALASDAFDVVLVAAGVIAADFADSVVAGDVEALALVKVVAQSDSAVALDSWAFAIASPAGPLTAEQTDSAVASDAFAAAGGSTLTELSIINLWNGAAWVHWNGSTWV